MALTCSPTGCRPAALGSALKFRIPRHDVGVNSTSEKGGAAKKARALPLGSATKRPSVGSGPQLPSATSEKMGGTGSNCPRSCSREGER